MLSIKPVVVNMCVAVAYSFIECLRLQNMRVQVKYVLVLDQTNDVAGANALGAIRCAL